MWLLTCNYNNLNNFFAVSSKQLSENKLERKIVKMQVKTSAQNENETGDHKDAKRLPLKAYLDARIIGTYDCSMK